jgi:hypothetical protein
MNWTDEILNQLALEAGWAYRAGGVLASEPLALASLALSGYQRTAAAQRAALRLSEMQNPDGSVGVTLNEPTPGWPTSLAALSWAVASRAEKSRQSLALGQARDRGIAWLLATQGDASIRNPVIGHDASLRGWPWAEGTHSWIEPTALAVLALKATGYSEHPRTREAVALLIDRLLPNGGCNYGNTTVLGQTLLPQPTSSGLALAALAGESDPSGRLTRTVDYLRATLKAETTCLSLAYGLIGLAAHDCTPKQAGDWLARAARRAGREAAPYKRALLTLAALGRQCPLISSNVELRVHA